MGRLKVTQVRSPIGGTANQRHTLRSLGLRRIRDVAVQPDRPEIRGMVATVAHLVTVEEITGDAAAAKSTRLTADQAIREGQQS